MRNALLTALLTVVFLATILTAQNRTILVPRQVEGSPVKYTDDDDFFGQAYRWFQENETDSAVVNLTRLIEAAGFPVDPNSYYVVVAHFMDSYAPIGVIHKDTDFFGTRMYGLKEDNLYYVFISRAHQDTSFLSVLATAKDSPFLTNLPGFLNFVGVLPSLQAVKAMEGVQTWIEVRRFNVPKAFQKFSDLSFVVKKNLSDETDLTSAVFDNTSKERWSYGVLFALTSLDEVDIIVGSDGKIIVQPKPTADPAVFGVINFHFSPVDTKQKTLGNSFHLLGGLRVGGNLEPIIGIGGGVSLDVIDLHAFVGYSVEFANELKDKYKVGDEVGDVDPFKTKIRGMPRFGLEVKFP